MLKEFEMAAARAGRSRPLPETASTQRAPAAIPAAAPPPDEEPVTIEVYRAPRVEVYRRRPSGDFERD